MPLTQLIQLQSYPSRCMPKCSTEESWEIYHSPDFNLGWHVLSKPIWCLFPSVIQNKSPSEFCVILILLVLPIKFHLQKDQHRLLGSKCCSLENIVNICLTTLYKVISLTTANMLCTLQPLPMSTMDFSFFSAHAERLYTLSTLASLAQVCRGLVFTC